MKKRTGIKRALLALTLLIPLILSGCYANTPTIEGNSGDLYPEYPTASVGVSGTGTASPQGGVITIGTGAATPTVAPLTSQTPIVVSTIAPATVIPTTVGPSASPSATPSGILKLGASGQEVRDLQTKLKSLGFYKGSVDGDFGAATETAVKSFQKQYGLTADGIAGTSTLKALANAKTTAKPTASPTPKATAKPEYDSNTYLKYGNSGALVRKVQARLIELGYLTGTATGDFDLATEAAVIAFQKRNCSYWDGIAGKITLDALFSSSAKSTSSSSGIIGDSLKEGSSGTAVRSLQTRLKALGYYKGEVDGDYGAATTTAVEAFQRANNLSVDGKAGSATTAKLFSADAISASAAAATATPKPTATPTPTPIPDNIYVLVTAAPDGEYVTLRRGNYGSLVRSMQQALYDQKYYTGTVDGYFGEGTENAVKAFQRAKGLDVDGAAGPATLRVLYEGDFPIGS